MTRSEEETRKTDKGFGLRRVVILSRSIVIDSEDVETKSTFEIWDRLFKAFKRKYLYDWYSRNHKRYGWGELFVEATVVKDEVAAPATFWSKTHGVRDETASIFFRSATRELAQKIIARKYRTFYIEVLGVALWRAKK